MYQPKPLISAPASISSKDIPSAMSSLDACEKQASFLAFNWISLSLAVFRVPVCPSSSHSPEMPPNRLLVLSAPSKAGTFFVSLPIAHTVALGQIGRAHV